MSQNSQYINAELIVQKIHAVLGRFPTYRALHADGRLYKGEFKANSQASKFTRAIHMQGEAIPVTVRYSKGGGDPFAHFDATVGMATRFYLPDGRFTNLVTISQKLFFANTVQQLIDLVSSAIPAQSSGGLNKEGLNNFLAHNPNCMAVFKMRAESMAPVSFAHTEFHAVHAFHFINQEDTVTNARYHWVPVAGVKGQPPKVLAEEDVSVLFSEMEKRLEDSTVEFDLVLELAEPGDPLNDATALWPADRKRVTIGRLRLDGPTTPEEIGDSVMNHDPTKLTDGIEATDDPILQIRRGVYEFSAAERSGGWKSCPFSRAE